ncbi:MAG: Alcohol dehydrogenase, zinc-binding domain protein [uncultured Nocardioidaceae bacterium]|uniref:Alcohol dehydrogenase, zinc-binding domain protein n=1 Tax=uncultured Nocardioidaceae bacterium TaxID=253824 RepID=A0A6J4ML96_9ACTN|nr:MAG: Alcohol dehydrogenase, zinc-binding domain protein [uncultured Nocardioidaceae bacterium]
MRAITYTATGDPDVLTLSDKPVADPGPGEVRVRIHRSGVNPTDWKSRRGASPGTKVDPPQVPDQDGSGVVDAVGEGVEAALHGLRVWVWEAADQRPEGTAQEYALVPAHQVVLLPGSASFDLGAALGVPFLTAHRCLTVTEGGPTRLGPGTLEGRTVLVSGGAGAVGNAAIQLARWSDATVITTVSSPRKGHLAARAGADHVIDYTQQDVVSEIRALAPRGVDTVVEVAAAANAEIDAQVVGLHGSVAVYADDDGAALTLPVRSLMAPNARWQFVLVYTAPHTWKLQAVEDVSAAVLDGAVRVGEEAGLPLHHFPLERTAEAHAAVENGAVGKVLVVVTD